MKPEQIWQAALGELQLETTRATFNTWLRDTRLVAYEDGVFVIGVRNGYAKDWLENRLASTIRRVLTRLTKRSVEVRFVVWEEPSSEPPPPLLLSSPAAASHRAEACPLNPRYTFDTFVVGPENRLAYAAARAVAERPGDGYNPLFIYGGTGLGKTHLLHAIGHVCQAHGRRVLYVPTETFTNDLIEAIRTGTTEAFRETYRTVDVLLIDDIQFIAGKEATQEEFFHTFNALHDNGAQIVISSDRRPRAMPTLEERLRSRFEWGLMVDVPPPALETRIAILQRKAEIRGVVLPEETLYFIAQRVQTNIRELEGVLNKLLILAQIHQEEPNLNLAQAALADIAAARPTVSADQILEAVSRYYQIDREDLIGPSRARRFARPRQIAMYLMREETAASLSRIGQELGGRDHSTVLHACERIARLVEEDEQLRREVAAIREALYHSVRVPA
ncbi:MAG TPA: chromosomal replication initiator protein DnaA [Chloroflexi bacterium]|nr:chromosomal replication initiator protein DnaA [Chloroflexota bacterium]